MSDVQSYLARRVPRAPTDPDELRVLRGAAWRQQGIAVLPLGEIRDEWIRQIVANEANRLYGRRKETGHDR